MANGVAALQALVEPTPDHRLREDSSNGAPAAAPTATEIELGEAVASATGAFCFMLGEYQNGGVTDKTRMANGERVAKIVMMQLAYEFGDDDFARRARDAAKPILHQSFDAEYFQRWSQQQADQAVDFYINTVLEVVGRVVASERALARAMAR